ncbi:hypothetical protein BJY00DRAFT_99257 [Aspergillus carlsbadensis]|nr:hypothetical protein BJY00DRAFT_99257 [Aspergillus carlsbadensis]
MSFPCQATRCGTSAPTLHPRKFDSEYYLSLSLFLEKRSRLRCAEALSERRERPRRPPRSAPLLFHPQGGYAKFSTEYLASRLVKGVDCVDHQRQLHILHQDTIARIMAAQLVTVTALSRRAPFALTSRLFFKVWRTLLRQRSEHSIKIEMILLTQIFHAHPPFVP